MRSHPGEGRLTIVIGVSFVQMRLLLLLLLLRYGFVGCVHAGFAAAVVGRV